MTTIREIRTSLFHLENQEMTIAELRAMLFNAENQDAELDITFSMWKNLERNYKQAQAAAGEFPLQG